MREQPAVQEFFLARFAFFGSELCGDSAIDFALSAARQGPERRQGAPAALAPLPFDVEVGNVSAGFHAERVHDGSGEHLVPSEENLLARLAAKRPRPTSLSGGLDGSAADGARRSFSAGKSATVPTLWPEKARKHGMRVILRGAAEFLSRRGWCPNTQELATMLGTSKAAVQWFSHENQERGLMEPFGDSHRPNFERRLTARGWLSLGLQPIVPWRRRPSADVRARIAEKVVRDVVRALKAQA